jgi:hypothetical protein
VFQIRRVCRISSFWFSGLCSNAFYTMVKTHPTLHFVTGIGSVRCSQRGRIHLRLLIKPLRLRFGFYLEDLSPEHAEFLFKTRLAQRVVPISQFQGDICPVLRPQCVERGRKEDGLLHLHVLPLAVDEIMNDFVHSLTKKILVAQYSLDRLRDSSKPARSLLMLGNGSRDLSFSKIMSSFGWWHESG